MEHAKKMVLIDPKELEHQRQQDQQFVKPIPDPRVESISALDREMQDILHSREGVSDYDKLQRYREVLTRYLHLVDNYRNRPIGRVEISEPKNSHERKEDIINEVVDSLPKPLKKKGELLLRRLRANSDVDWNRRGEIKYKSDWIQGSNLTDLVSEALRYKPREEKAFPTGWKEFQDILIAENVPRKLLGAGSNHTSAASPLGSGQVTETPEKSFTQSPEKLQERKPVKTRSKRSLKLWTPY
ncbi:hypothetical protein PoB_002172900 [Plakobranchus ocellatus]|uniref:Uncharacterized protein n=1 Tax=Plakobranchus ocellatus TaxID=259542 RepID=A0AAV3ZLH3_9GAST|nr:hypothetical protein PoB_002172900 [Plakobranchus ocellatus]